MTLPGVPEGYRSVSPYLVVSDLDSAVEFLEAVFGARERIRLDMDGGGVHCELELGDSVLMLGAGGGMSFPAMVHVYTDDADAVYERALEHGATSAATPHETDFGDHRAAFDDPWGNQWWVATRAA